jgi:hypothetical protein
MTMLGGTVVIFGMTCYLFAKLGRWSYHGGPASWSPKFWRGEEVTGLVLLGLGSFMLLIGLLVG